MAERREVVSNCEGSLKKSPEMASRGSKARQRRGKVGSHARRGCACARRPIFCSPMPNGGIHEAGEEAKQKRYEVAQDHARIEF